MPRPQTITDEEIRATAREVFLEQGPGASVATIAARLGVSHAALFQRAGSKTRLMFEALAVERPAVLGLLDQPPPASEVHAKLVEILVALHDFLARLVPGLVVLRAAGKSLPGPPPGKKRGGGDGPPPVRLRAALTRWLRAAIDDGNVGPCDAEVVAEAILGAMEARCFNAYLGGEDYVRGDADEFISRMVAGLVPAASA